MPTLRHTYIQDDYILSDEYREVVEISDKLLKHLNEPEARRLLSAANMPGVSSAMVQDSFALFTDDLGFTSEAKGLFSAYDNKLLRPDFYLPLKSSGILMEVERGKTITNNMDLLDLWKCHLCEHADYLFLMAPQALRHNPTMTPKKEYKAVVKRLGSFFLPQNHTNVRGLHIFGY